MKLILRSVRTTCSLILIFNLPPFHLCFGQDKLPVLASGTREIKIKFIEDPLISWHLEPDKDPDVFQIGSTLKTKHVTFITDKDSMTFEVKAGQQIDFIILLNGGQECHTRIVVLKTIMMD